MKNIALRFFGDVYRGMAFILDWRGHLRNLFGKTKYDVACITNFENAQQKNFRGFFSCKKDVIYGLRFSLKKICCRYLLINSTSADLSDPLKIETAKAQVKEAIALAVKDGAKVILFAASTKRLLSEKELLLIQSSHSNVIFTIGDNGTSMSLISDVFGAIGRHNLNRSSSILILGPNGFLGASVLRTLQREGYQNLSTVSSQNPAKIHEMKNIQLIIACTHHTDLKLSAEILEKIAHAKGIHVVDVCKPANLTKKEFKKTLNVSRQDSGQLMNNDLKYTFSAGAYLLLKKIHLRFNLLYGCFSEAMVLGLNYAESIGKANFLSVNPEATSLIADLLIKENFISPPPKNFGKSLN